MHVRITTISFQPAKEPEIRRIIDEQLIPMMQRLPGFQSYLGGLDSATGRGCAVSVWDSEDHAQGFRTALGGLIQEFEALSVRFDPAQVFAVVTQV